MRDRQTLLALAILESFEASKGSASGYNLMAQACLVFLEVVVVVDLLVTVLAVICTLLAPSQSKGSRKTNPRNPLCLYWYVVGVLEGECKKA